MLNPIDRFLLFRFKFGFSIWFLIFKRLRPAFQPLKALVGGNGKADVFCRRRKTVFDLMYNSYIRINCIALGKRICFYRLKFNITQEKLAALTNCSREYIAYLESGTKTPSLPTLIDLANVLHISVDDLLVDSLDYSFSTSGSDLHRLLLDCNQTEQEIIIRMVKELKATLASLGI